MKKVLSFILIIFFVWTAKAQVNDNSGNTGDSARHLAVRHSRNFYGSDSAHRKFGRYHDEVINPFGHGRRMNRADHFARSKSGWAFAGHLHYSADQRKVMQRINEEFRKKSQDLYRQDNITLGQYKSQLLALQKDRKSKLMNILTPQQKTEKENWEKHVSEEMQVKAAAILERMKIHLNLSDDQTAKIRSQQSDFQTQLKAIHQNDNLLEFQKKDQIKALIAKRQDAIKTVLTPEQFAQYGKMHRQRFGERFERNNMN